MKKRLVCTFLVSGFLGSGAVAADESEAMKLAEKHNCLACHSIESKKVGPAWQDVGKKYADDPAAREYLIAKVKKGGSGVWGSMPMPPNPTAKKADLEVLVDYILTLRP